MRSAKQHANERFLTISHRRCSIGSRRLFARRTRGRIDGLVAWEAENQIPPAPFIWAGQHTYKGGNEEGGHSIQLSTMHCMYIRTQRQSLRQCLDKLAPALADTQPAALDVDDVLNLHRLFDCAATVEICQESYAAHQPLEHLRKPLRCVGLSDLAGGARPETAGAAPGRDSAEAGTSAETSAETSTVPDGDDSDAPPDVIEAMADPKEQARWVRFLYDQVVGNILPGRPVEPTMADLPRCIELVRHAWELRAGDSELLRQRWNQKVWQPSNFLAAVRGIGENVALRCR